MLNFDFEILGVGCMSLLAEIVYFLFAPFLAAQNCIFEKFFVRFSPEKRPMTAEKFFT